MLDAGLPQILALSLKVAAIATLFCLPFGLLAGWLLARGRFWGKTFVETLISLPLALPPVVVGFALLALFGSRGPIGGALHNLFGVEIAFTWKGAALAAAIVGFPLMARAIRLSIESIDPGIEKAARTLGARPLRVFATVTLPLALPGVLAGVALTFARSLGEFGATVTFVGNIPGETQTLPLAIYTALQMPGGDAIAWKLALLSILISLAAMGISEWLARAQRKALAR